MMPYKKPRHDSAKWRQMAEHEYNGQITGFQWNSRCPQHVDYQLFEGKAGHVKYQYEEVKKVMLEQQMIGDLCEWEGNTWKI